jgi:hypothetical protein
LRHQSVEKHVQLTISIHNIEQFPSESSVSNDFLCIATSSAKSLNPKGKTICVGHACLAPMAMVVDMLLRICKTEHASGSMAHIVDANRTQIRLATFHMITKCFLCLSTSEIELVPNLRIKMSLNKINTKKTILSERTARFGTCKFNSLVSK